MSLLRRTLLVLASTGVLSFGLWWAAASAPDDPKGPRFTLWKAGLWPFDAKVVYGAMGHANADALVVGRTIEEVESGFDRVRPRPALRPYLKNPSLADRDVRWLGDSMFCVVIERGRVVALHNVKGL